MRSINLSDEILKEYLLDEFNTEDKTIIKDELSKRLSEYNVRELEIGCGNGKFIVELAMNNKDKYFIGIEYSYKAAKKAVSKAYKRNIARCPKALFSLFTLNVDCNSEKATE